MISLRMAFEASCSDSQLLTYIDEEEEEDDEEFVSTQSHILSQGQNKLFRRSPLYSV